MSSKINKDELKHPDAFITLSDHIFAWVQKHGKNMVLVAVAVVVLGASYVGYTFLQARAENQAAEALYAPQAELKKAETQVREDRAKQMASLAGLNAKDKKTTRPESARPVDYAKDYQPIVAKVKVQIQSHADTKAALVAAMNLSYFLLQQKQYAEALAVLDLPKYTPSHGDLLSGFWQMHRGLTLMENQKFEEAAKIYQSVSVEASLKAFQPEALLKLGVAFEQKGEADKARQTYEKLGREFPNSEASASAQQYLRLLDLKTQKG